MPNKFQRCFVAWVASVTGLPEGVIAIDGKTVRRSGRKTNDKAPIHMVSAFAARQRLVLGQVKVAEKSNEIIAISKLLRMLAEAMARELGPKSVHVAYLRTKPHPSHRRTSFSP